MKPKEVFIWGALTITVCVHLLSFLPFFHLRLTSVWPLTLVPIAALMSTFGIVFQLLRREYPARFERLPRGIRVGSWVSFTYSFMALLVGLHTTGTPEVRASAFVLTEHGRVVRTLTEAEYWKLARGEVALLFGLLIAFVFGAIVNNALANQTDVD